MGVLLLVLTRGGNTFGVLLHHLTVFDALVHHNLSKGKHDVASAVQTLLLAVVSSLGLDITSLSLSGVLKNHIFRIRLIMVVVLLDLGNFIEERRVIP